MIPLVRFAALAAWLASATSGAVTVPTARAADDAQELASIEPGSASSVPETGELSATDPSGGAFGEDDVPELEKEAARVAALCSVLVAAADAHGVPHDFFIRLIWKESRFNDGAVSPVGAQGIAQFMPATARLRGLEDPFDRRQALFASASFLADLRAEFGSWGLAAAGYNGGPNRLPAFIAGEGGLPYETIDYVFSITGRPAEYWAARTRDRIARGERDGEPAGWIGRGLSDEEVASLVPAPQGHRSGDGAGSADAAVPPASDPGEAGEAAAAAPPETGEAASAAPDDAGAEETGASPGTRDAAAGGAAEEERTMPRHPPTLLALARPPFALPVPRARPDHGPTAVDCPDLVTRLGRSRSVAPPSVAGGWTPWGAQVAGHVRREVAMRQYDRLKARLPGDLVATGPRVVVRRFAARGRLPVHAVQFAAASRGEAEALCARIARSLAPCVVVRNS